MNFRKYSVLAWLWLMISAVGCASATPQRGAASGLPALGKPLMTQTGVGDLASWEVPGSGPTLVLWPSIFSDHRIYQEVVERWKGKYRIILVDGPGHGSSGAPPQSGFTMAQCARALKSILDARGISQAVVAGTSWGGLVATEFALAYPQQTMAVIAMNTPFLMPDSGPGLADKMITFGARHALNSSIFAWGVSRSFFLPATREQGGPMIKAFDQHLRQADPQALSISIRAVLLDRRSLAPDLPRIARPTLVIAGQYDAMYPAGVLEQAVATIPNAQFSVVESQHISVVDQPEAVAALVDRFVIERFPVR